MTLLQPEAKKARYYVHIVVLSAIVLGILQFWQDGDMFNFKNIIYSSIIIGAADIVTHSIFAKVGYPT